MRLLKNAGHMLGIKLYLVPAQCPSCLSVNNVAAVAELRRVILTHISAAVVFQAMGGSHQFSRYLDSCAVGMLTVIDIVCKERPRDMKQCRPHTFEYQRVRLSPL